MKKGMCVLLAMILLFATVGCTGAGGDPVSGATSSKASSVNGSEPASPSDLSSQEETASVETPNADVSFETASLVPATGSVSFDLKAHADAKTALRNPDKGWYLHYYDDGTYNYGAQKSAEWILDYMSYLDHIYIRLPWCTIEPSEGQFQWSIIDTVIKDFADHGVAVSFRITCKEGGSYCPYATPKWVRDAGANGWDQTDGSWEPDYADEIFLQKLDNFHKAFSEHIAGMDVRYVDVGSYGDYGEGHNSSSAKEGGSKHVNFPWKAIQKHFDIYAKYYPNYQVVVSDDFIGSGNVTGIGAGGANIRNYVKEHGWTWRDDSICVDWFMKNYAETDSVRSPKLFDETWESKPVIMELEHYKEVLANQWHGDNWRDGAVFKAACQRTHATYAGFHGFIDQFMTGNNIQFANEMANLLGYWYFLDKVDVARSGSRLTCKFAWQNKGFAKAYNVYDLDLILTDGKGKDHVFNMKDFDNTAIMPDQALTTSHTVDLGDLPGGEYVVSVRMHKGDTPVLLALDKELKGKDGRYTIGKIAL